MGIIIGDEFSPSELRKMDAGMDRIKGISSATPAVINIHFFEILPTKNPIITKSSTIRNM